MIPGRRDLFRLAAALALAPALARAAPPPVRVAFVDTGNTGRSLMAETLARDLATRRGLNLRFISRGLEVDPWDEAPEANAAALMMERGLSVAGHVARPLETRDIGGADLILVMTLTHREKVLARAGLSLSDIGAFEVNEAFAAVIGAWLADTGADPSRVNPLGGAIALGHPLGASGARLTSTLVHHMRRNDIRYGLQTMCEGGGMANAMVLELLG